MTPAEADRVNRHILGRLAVPGLEPTRCPVHQWPWYVCRNRHGQDPAHDALVRRLVRAGEPGTLFGTSLVMGAVLGTQPLTRTEGALLERLAHGKAVPVHPSACSSVPDCWHARVWHRNTPRDRSCLVPGCECLDYVPQKIWPGRP